MVLMAVKVHHESCDGPRKVPENVEMSVVRSCMHLQCEIAKANDVRDVTDCAIPQNALPAPEVSPKHCGFHAKRGAVFAICRRMPGCVLVLI